MLFDRFLLIGKSIFEIRQFFMFYRPSPIAIFPSPMTFKNRQIGDISPSLATLEAAEAHAPPTLEANTPPTRSAEYGPV